MKGKIVEFSAWMVSSSCAGLGLATVKQFSFTTFLSILFICFPIAVAAAIFVFVLPDNLKSKIRKKWPSNGKMTYGNQHLQQS